MSSLFTKRTYLDWAAAAPVSRSARRAYDAALSLSGNPSSPHQEGRDARILLEEARTSIARLAGVKADAVIFTSGATEANALAIVGHVHARIEKGRSASELHVLYLPSAHASVRGALHGIEAMGVRTEELVLTEGALDLERLKKQLSEATCLVVLDLVCGETGVLHKVRDVRRALDAYAKEKGNRPLLIVDASQAPLVESFELAHLGADMVTLDAQKVGGVRGIGALIAPRHIPLLPIVEGGGQERGLRPGTESPAHATAFACALTEAAKGREVFLARSVEMRGTLIESIAASLKEVEVNEGNLQAPHILNLSVLGRDTDYLVALLDEAGYAVSTKSACETDELGSRAVLALTGDSTRAESTLRISWGPTTLQASLPRFADALISAVRFVDGNTIY